MPSMSNNPLSMAAIVSNTNPAQKPGPEPIHGKHVTLEFLTENHFTDLWENIGAHHDLWTWWPEGPFNTPADFNQSLINLLGIRTEDLTIYAVILLRGPNKGKAVGLAISMSEDRMTNRVAEFGLFFGPLLQKTRAATEAVYLVANLMFELNHRRLAWKTNSLNLPSRRAAERFGFVYEGTFRQDQINKRRNRDSAWFSIIDAEWLLCKVAFERWLDDKNFDKQGQQRLKLEEIRESLKQAGE